jgi:hypothetical protein
MMPHYARPSGAQPLRRRVSASGFVAALTAVAFGVMAASASAQSPAPPPPSRLEVRMAGVLAPATHDGLVTSTYLPTYTDGTVAGSLSQVLQVEAAAGSGFEIGVDTFVTRSLGLQVAFTRTTATVSGTNDPYQLSYVYSSIMPGETQPRQTTYNVDVVWPDTDGTLTQTTLSAGLVARRGPAAARLSGSLAVGGSASRFGGRLRGLAYTRVRLGSYTALSYLDDMVEMAPDGGRWIWRPYAAGDLRWHVTRRFGFVAGGRVMLGSGTARVPSHVIGLVDPDDTSPMAVLDNVKATIGSPDTTLALSRWQVSAGLVFVVK